MCKELRLGILSLYINVNLFLMPGKVQPPSKITPPLLQKKKTSPNDANSKSNEGHYLWVTVPEF